jgi:hypothetical protein
MSRLFLFRAWSVGLRPLPNPGQYQLLRFFAGVADVDRSTGGGMEAKTGLQKCSCCKQVFTPDRRSRGRQKFCSKRECRKTSKKESQRRWAAKPENKDYWRGPEQVARVQAWRKNQPEYWRRAAKKIALQEKIPQAPLQDHIIAKDPLIVGLVSFIAQSTLQDKIAATCRDLIALGYEVLQVQAKGAASASQPLNSFPKGGDGVHPHVQ